MAISGIGSSNPLYLAALNAAKGKDTSTSATKAAEASAGSNTASTDDFTKKLADSNPSVSSALAQLRATQSLFGLADATFSNNSSGFANLFGVNSSNPFYKALSAAYLAPVQEKYDELMKSRAADANSIIVEGENPVMELEAGLSVTATSKAQAGSYSLRYDEKQKMFTLMGGNFQINASMPTDINGKAKDKLDFGNGLTLNLGDTFNPANKLKEQRFSVSFA